MKKWYERMEIDNKERQENEMKRDVEEEKQQQQRNKC